MSTIADLAHEFNAQPYELAAYFDLGADYDEFAELDETTEAEYRQVWAMGQEEPRPVGVLTADDVKALRRAETVVFRLRNGRYTIEAGIGWMTEARTYTAAEQRIFPDLSTGSSERERVIETFGAIQPYGSGTYTARYSTGFAMINSAQFTQTWITIASLLRAGDVLSLRFLADAHTNDNLRKAGLHGDVLRLDVTRDQGHLVIDGTVLAFDVISSTSPDNTARMVRA